ncbi:MAG: hypothetical protein NTZ59_11690 [Bacteroidetes bacterium]|nr:hypothetical protein [Bacteroidota bacterium]
MSILYKDPKEVKHSVEISQEDGLLKLEFSADCGKFGTDESLAGFELTIFELLEILNKHFNK